MFAPEHARKIAASEWTRSQVSEYLFENAVRSFADLKRGGKVERSGLVKGFDPTLGPTEGPSHAVGLPATACRHWTPVG